MEADRKALFLPLCEKEFGQSFDPDLLLLIERKLTASSSSPLFVIYNSLKSILEALFLIDWEPAVALKLLLPLIPMLKSIPGLLGDYRVKLDALMSGYCNLQKQSLVQCFGLLRILLAEKLASVAEVYAWLSFPIGQFIRGQCALFASFCDQLISVLSFPFFSDLVVMLFHHIELELSNSDASLDCNQILVMQLMTTIICTSSIPDFAGIGSITLSSMIENPASKKYSIVLLRLYLLSVHGINEERNNDEVKKQSRTESVWRVIDEAELRHPFKFAMLGCLATMLSVGGAEKFEKLVGNRTIEIDFFSMWKSFILCAGISVEEILFVYSSANEGTDESLEMAFRLSLFCMEDKVVDLTSAGYMSGWIKQLDLNGQRVVMRAICEFLLSTKSKQSAVASLQFLLYEVVRGNTAKLSIGASEAYYLLNYLSPHLTSIPPIFGDSLYQLQWLDELRMNQKSVLSVLPMLAVRESLHPDCCNTVVRTYQDLVSRYFGKNLNPNVYNTSIGRRFNVGALSTKQASRHSLSGYKEELMPSLTENWESVIYLFGLLRSACHEDSLKNLALYVEGLITGDAKKDLLLDGTLQDVLDAVWDIIAPCPFTAVDLHKMEPTLHFVFIHHTLLALFKLGAHTFAETKDTIILSTMKTIASLLFGSFAALRYATHDEVLHLSGLRLFSLDYVPRTKDKLSDPEKMDSDVDLLKASADDPSAAYEQMCILPFRRVLSQLSASVAHCLRIGDSVVQSRFELISETQSLPTTLQESAQFIASHNDAAVKPCIQSYLSLLLVSVGELNLAVEHINSLLSTASVNKGIAEQLLLRYHGASDSDNPTLSVFDDRKSGLFEPFDQSSHKNSPVKDMNSLSNDGSFADADNGKDDDDSFVLSPAFSLAAFSTPKAESKAGEFSFDNSFRDELNVSKKQLDSAQDIISSWKSYLSISDLQTCQEHFNSLSSIGMHLRCELFNLMIQLTNYIQKIWPDNGNSLRTDFGRMIPHMVEYFTAELLLGCEKGINLREFKDSVCLIGHLSDILNDRLEVEASVVSAANLLGAVQFIANDVPQHVHRVVQLALTLCPKAHSTSICFYLIRSAQLTKTQRSIDDLSSDDEDDTMASEMSIEHDDSHVAFLPSDRIVNAIIDFSSLNDENISDIVAYSNKIVGDTIIAEVLKFIVNAFQSRWGQQGSDGEDDLDHRDLKLMNLSESLIKIIVFIIRDRAARKKSLIYLLDQRASSVFIQTLTKYILWCSEEVASVIPSSGKVPSIVRYVLLSDQSDSFVGVSRVPCLYVFMTEAFYEVICQQYTSWIRGVFMGFSKDNKRRAETLGKKFNMLGGKLQALVKTIKGKKLNQVQEFSAFMVCAESAARILQSQAKNISPSKKSTRVSDEEDASHVPVLFDRKRRSPKKSAENKRLRSRNNVIDKWLDGDEGDDAFVDLEDFLVDEENEELVE
eukprot:gene25745-31093_t